MTPTRIILLSFVLAAMVGCSSDPTPTSDGNLNPASTTQPIEVEPGSPSHTPPPRSHEY